MTEKTSARKTAAGVTAARKTAGRKTISAKAKAVAAARRATDAALKRLFDLVQKTIDKLDDGKPVSAASVKTLGNALSAARQQRAAETQAFDEGGELDQIGSGPVHPK